MKKQFVQTIIGLIAAASLAACGNKTSNAVDNNSATDVTPPAALSVYAASSIVALGATTTITVTGGSGTYVTATATLGTLVASGASTFTYTAPSSATTSSETVTITDSNGLSGSAYLTISGGGGTGGTTGTTSCSGTYNVSLMGIPATMTLVGGANGYVAGNIKYWNYTYAIYGSCSITGSSGSITLTEPMINSTFSGTVSLSGSTISMTGTATNAANSGVTAYWTATATTAAVTAVAPTTNSCQGTYNATIGPNSGQILMVQDGNNKVAGVMSLAGYYYPVTGTCSGGSISLSNAITGSTYSGTVSFTSTGATMSGTYSIPNGTVYNWSATR